jgi:hypothetical protein
MHKNPFPDNLLSAVMNAKKPSGVLVAPCRCKDDAVVKYTKLEGKVEIKCLKCNVTIRKQL